jgi:ATP-dependent DNA helicase RecG
MGLALHLPLRYEDRATLTAMDALTPGDTVNITATVVGQELQRGPRKQLKVWVEDGHSQLLLRWVNVYPGLAEKMAEGTRLKVSGKIRQGYGMLEIVHPQVKIVPPWEIERPQQPVHTDKSPSQILSSDASQPVYPSTGDIKQSDWARWIKSIPAACFEDTLPPAAIQKMGFMPWGDALRTLHGEAQPHDVFDLNGRTHPAWQRIKFDELLAQQLLLKQYRAHRSLERAPALKVRAIKVESNKVGANKPSSGPVLGSNLEPQLGAPKLRGLKARTPTLRERFMDALGFQLTGAQNRAIAEIAADLAQPHPMQRLLQGDVGSGKTVVAALSCLIAVENGMQAAILAPTEVLAEQHYYKLGKLFDQIGVRCARLQGAMKKSEKNKVNAELQSGTIDIVIGTHALVQDSVQFASLAMVVVDEQHRFGVAQRLSLIGKAQGGQLAHQLMMSATPIPRTLAQTYLSDLSVSNLDEKPPGRKPIITKLLSQKKREQLIAAIEHEIAKGQQVYWVCPLIEENEKLDLQAAEITHAQLQEALPHRKVGLLHGRQEAKHKQAVMQAFSQGEINLLVSTTVIEVGVDVSNASLMVIDQAERFGLAQLHQLRGRVGRGSIQSVCVLLYGGPLSNTAKTRLKAMHESDDGFYLAEVDLELRGPGELLGKRQSGMPMMRYGDPLMDKPLVEKARALATEMESASVQTQRHIARWVEDTAWWLS